ncbi:hypothetical protein Tco_0875781 [Tanacetum coccineum]|uniref:Uncharacterized protein n=1 Tax=Tanacetum coccineum TaxID=301880 RepID=A0ABQ5BQK3_9ASTR
MSSITAQQTKLDLELVPKEKRFEIRKCNGRLNPRKKQREPTFQVVLDALALTPCYSAFLIIADVPEVYMHQFWDTIHKYENSYRFRMDKKKKFDLNLETFRDIFQIYPRVHGQNFNELPTDEDIVSFFKELGHTGEIKTIIDIIVDQMHQPWRKFSTIINRSLSGKTTGLDKLRISRAQILWGISTTEFKKPASKLSTVPTSPDEPTRKSRVKRPAKKSSDAPIAGVVIRETPVKSLSKKKEKMTVEKRKGIDLLSKVTLIKEAQYEEVRKKSLRDFHKTHPSGSGTVTKLAPSAAKIKHSITNEGTCVKPGVPDVAEEESTKSEGSDQERDSGDDKDQSDSEKGSYSEHETDENESGSESDQEENEEEDENGEEEKNDEFVKTPSNDTDDEDETKIKDKAEGDEDEGMDYTTNQFDDDVNVSLNEPVDTDKGFIQKEGTDVEMTNVQEGNENPEIS